MAKKLKDILNGRIKKPSRNKYTLNDLINCTYNFTARISDKEKDVYAASVSFRRLLLWIGIDEFGLENGFAKLANIPNNRNGNAFYPIKTRQEFDTKAHELRLEIVELLIEAQDGYEFMRHIDAKDGSLSWPYPSQFKNIIENGIMDFEGDHLLPIRLGGTNSFDNIVIATANTNQFIKNQLTVNQLLVKHANKTEMCQRIRDTLARRKTLFASNQWGDLIQRLLDYEK